MLTTEHNAPLLHLCTPRLYVLSLQHSIGEEKSIRQWAVPWKSSGGEIRTYTVTRGAGQKKLGLWGVWLLEFNTALSRMGKHARFCNAEMLQCPPDL